MSDTATPKIVQPKMTWNSILDAERIIKYNLRLNNFGRMIISRHHSDNPQLLLTQFGFNWLRDCKTVNVTEFVSDKGVKTFRTKVNSLACEKLAQEKFYSLVNLASYPDFIAKMYSEPQNISFRSAYSGKTYFEMLNKYGHNRAVKLPSVVVQKMLGLLDKKLKPWMQDSRFEFDFGEFLATGKWLTHIKTNSNSGYPDNIKQDKEIMTRYASSALKVFSDYQAGREVNWKKLAFEMGYRTERKGKHRVICMACTIEKVISSVFSTFLDFTCDSLPFNLPRKYGGTQQHLDELLKHNGNLVTKDFDAYDTSIPLHIFRFLEVWFKACHNTIGDILAFECALIINSYMIVGPQLLFEISSLPSGIGTTQFFGSLIHWLLDFAFDIQYSFVMYQSDDNIGRTSMSLEEMNACIDTMMKVTGMSVSPYGKKSFFDPYYGRFLQKLLCTQEKIFFNHEQRAYTNGLFRERQISDDTVFNVLFNTKGKDVEHKKMVLAYLGNIVSYGQHAPSLANILSFMYGRKSGFTVTQVEWGLKNLEKYMSEYLSVEEHRPMESAGWTVGFFEKAMALHKWADIQPKDVAAILGSI